MTQKHKGNWQARTDTIAEHKKVTAFARPRALGVKKHRGNWWLCNWHRAQEKPWVSAHTKARVGPRNTGVAGRKPRELAPSYQENADALRALPRKPWELARPVRAKALELSATHNSHYFWMASGRDIRGHQGASGVHFAGLPGHQGASGGSRT